MGGAQNNPRTLTATQVIKFKLQEQGFAIERPTFKALEVFLCFFYETLQSPFY